MTKILRLLGLLLTICFNQTAFSAEQNQQTLPRELKLPVFQPKNVGAPKMRVGGGSRGGENANLELYVFAPEQPGITNQSQPTLYWYLSKPVSQPIEITITEKFKTVLKTTLTGIAQSGVQQFKLSDYQVLLQPNIKYKWSIAVINNPEQRSNDLFASAGIIYQPISENSSATIKNATLEQQIILQAEEGIWYDAIATVQTWVAESHQNETPYKFRATLLSQVGIPVFQSTPDF